jgi:hypothetical protein
MAMMMNRMAVYQCSTRSPIDQRGIRSPESGPFTRCGPALRWNTRIRPTKPASTQAPMFATGPFRSWRQFSPPFWMRTSAD